MSEPTPASEGATPSPGATPGAGTTPAPATGATPIGDGDLGEQGKRALAELRKERDDLRRQLQDRDDADKSELERERLAHERAKERLTERDTRIAELEMNERRRAAATAAGIPEQWQRLQGSTEDELAADAKKLAEWRGQPVRPAPDLGAGARPGGPATGEPGMTELIRRKAGRS
jgi:hypothetical protein